jgi:hypothetical protein
VLACGNLICPYLNVFFNKISSWNIFLNSNYDTSNILSSFWIYTSILFFFIIFFLIFHLSCQSSPNKITSIFFFIFRLGQKSWWEFYLDDHICATHAYIYIYIYIYHTRTSRRPYKFIFRTILWWGTVLFKGSPPSIMVTKNSNWSTKILWFGIDYVKGKILSPLKYFAWDRLHCWFCLKLL